MLKLFNTVKYLRFKQIYYRLFYIIRNKFFYKNYTKAIQVPPIPLIWKDLLKNEDSFLPKNTFNFLNIEHVFRKNIDWNLTNYGKLWTYNLNYFDFLNQKNIKLSDCLTLIEDYIKNDAILKDGIEPYPISLRGINWIKFLSKNNISCSQINQNLYNHYQILSHNLEYHLQGNHLLENGFSMLFGAYYFKDDTFYKKAKKILLEELNEQVLNDGSHFELSPMYHQILLHRLLDCIHLVKNNPWKEDKLFDFLHNKSIQMLSWLQSVTYRNGNIPMVNDSTYNIAPSSEQLFTYAKTLGLQWHLSMLKDSGYRKIEKGQYELFIDVGHVGPTYQLGHAQSDTFSFELYVNEDPIIVDTGISTYEKNKQRQLERSTASHNTVKIGKYEQTEVWGGFRVAERAKIVNLIETTDCLEATHDGYKKLNLLHTRKFTTNLSDIIISDSLSNKCHEDQSAFIHFHPDIKQVIILDNIVCLKNENLKIKFDGQVGDIEKLDYEYALGFNKRVKALKIKISFKTNLTTTIHL